jgi:hypothetical protein
MIRISPAAPIRNSILITTGSSPEKYACGEMISPGYQAVLVEAGTEQQSIND